jgi:hypothetical protein
VMLADHEKGRPTRACTPGMNSGRLAIHQKGDYRTERIITSTCCEIIFTKRTISFPLEDG